MSIRKDQGGKEKKEIIEKGIPRLVLRYNWLEKHHKSDTWYFLKSVLL